MLFVGNDGVILFLFLSPLVIYTSEVWSGLACLSNPCMHGVCIDDLNSTYFCYCIDGYTGVQCQTNWNECWSSPCQNGGICIDGVAAFNCSCPVGFVGDLCDEDFNECESNPCLNNGTCLDAANGYFCSCLLGYSGIHCEIDVAVCNTTNETRCANGGICLEGPGDTFSCNCRPGWSHFLCETEIDECLSAPCRNGGVCIDLLADYSCACLFGFAGRNCEEKVQICKKNPCTNGALCLIEDQHPVCYCVPDFHGDLCQYQYDECQLGPKCLNGGTCVDGIDNSTCSCPPNLTGVHCECLILNENKLDCTYSTPKPTTIKSITHQSIPSTMFTPSTIIITTDKEVPNVTFVEPYSTKITWSTSTENTPWTKTTFTIIKTVPSTLPSEKTETFTIIETTATEATAMPYNETSTIDTSTITMTSSTTFETYPVTSTVTDVSTEFKIVNMTSIRSKETTASSTEYSTSTIIGLPSIKTTLTEQTISTDFSKEETTTLPSSITTFLTKEPEITTKQIDLSTESSSTDVTYTTTSFPIDCTRTPCQNGGTCIYSFEAGYRCICPFDTDGKICEITLGVQKAAFTGDSYLKHQISNLTNISLEIEAKTLSNKGILFYATIDLTYMILYIENGYLKFKFSCGYQTMLLSEVKVPVNNGNLMKIKARLELSQDLQRCDASIKVNNSLSMTGDQIAFINRFGKPPGWLYLGGVSHELESANLPGTGFIGCMLKLKIAEKIVDIFKDAEDGFGVTECSSLACLSNPCSNGATCHSKEEEWSCSCKNGFLGKMCEISVCENNPCLYGGTCIPFPGSGYICLCPFGKHGHFCENDLKITEPNFSSTIRGLSSYVAYPIPGGVSETMEIKFRFVPSTIDQISLLLFMGQKGHHDYYTDHVAVSFVKGYLMLTWNLGSGPRRIFTTQPIEGGARDYLVKIGRTGRRGWLFVENLGNVTGRSPGNLIKLDVLPVLYLGGHDSKNFSKLPHDLPLHTGFSGCIFDVELISGNLVIPLQGSTQTVGRGVGQCGTTECYEQSCQNNGICLHHGTTFMCLCQDGWFGPLCSVRHNLCNYKMNKCAVGSLCVPVMSEYECDCPIGTKGKYCDKDEEISDVYFTGLRSFLSLPSLQFSDNRFNVEMEIRPLDDNGLLFFIQKAGISFISLSLHSGSLELKILSGKGKTDTHKPITITSAKILIKGIWHKIILGIYGKKIYLSVDNVVNSGLLVIESGLNLSGEHIYLGGLPDLSILPLQSISKLPVPYKGCIRHFSINSVHIPLNKQNILNARNIKDCDGTPCGKDACLNGGTCWLDSFMKPHCSCPLPFYGPKCDNFANCTDKVCQNSGKCVETKCFCQVGWDGAFCEKRIKVTKPEFTKGSYLVFANNNEKRRNIRDVEVKNLYLNFTTIQKDGLVLWSRKGNVFIGIGIEKGFLKIAYSNNNSMPISLPFYYKISDGLWHNLEIAFTPFMIRLDKNELAYKGKHKKILEDSAIATDGIFYIGGIPTKSTIFKETNGTFFETFDGCIEGFATNGNKIIRDFTTFEGNNIKICKIL